MTHCPLCDQPKELIQSHIIPEGFYRAMYDEKHRAIHTNNETLQTRWIQKGIRERLLCSTCDGDLIGPWDGYSSTFWNGQDGMPATLEEPFVVLEGLDYEKFKLFHLAVLYRAAISSWKNNGKIRLGPHLDRIKTILKSGRAPEPHVYPVWAIALVDDRDKYEVCREITFYAGSDHMWGTHIYIIVFGGAAWHYAVSSHVDDRIPHEFLDRAGRFHITATSIHSYRPMLERLPAIFAASEHNKS